MLHEFLTSNRTELIARCREKAAMRFEPTAIPSAIDDGVPLFMQQLAQTLHREEISPDSLDSDYATARSEAIRAAALHGATMLRSGFSIGQVVHSYGDVCQSVTELAVSLGAFISTDEFHTLNRCLDDAIADAVTAFGKAHQALVDSRVESLQLSLDEFAHEQQRLLDIAIQSYAAIRTGTIGYTGATGALLAYTLGELRSLSERALPGIRLANATTALLPKGKSTGTSS